MANGARLHTPVATITLVPIGAVVAAAVVLYLGGRWAGRHSTVTSLREVARGAVAYAAAYAFVVLAAAGVTRGSEVNAGVMRPTIAAFALGLVFGGAGILRAAGLSPRLLGRVPVQARAAATGAVAGVAVMLGVGALLVAGSLVAHFSTAVNLAEGLHTGLFGGLLTAVVGVAVLPNAVLCAGAFAAGPGFAVGAGTAVAPGGVTLGALPAFPLLAAVPHDASARWLQGLVLVPVVAGVVAGLTALRRCPTTRFERAGLLGCLAGMLFGLLFGLLSQLASGGIGPGRMQDFGPDVLATLVVCVVAGTLGGALAAGGSRFRPGYPTTCPRGILRGTRVTGRSGYLRPGLSATVSTVTIVSREERLVPDVDASAHRDIDAGNSRGLDPDRDAGERARLLVDALTFDEKIGLDLGADGCTTLRRARAARVIGSAAATPGIPRVGLGDDPGERRQPRNLEPE